jgi:integrase
MYVGMGLRKNRYGVYIVRHKVPERLEGPVARVLDNGKERQTYLQKSTGTKDQKEAKRIAVDVLAGFQETLRQAETLLAERPLRTALAQSEIDRIAEFHFASVLAGDEDFTTQGAQAEEDFTRSVASQFNEAGIEYEMPAPFDNPRPAYGLTNRRVVKRDAGLEWWLQNTRTALARGDISIMSEHMPELLDRFHLNLDPDSAAYRRLGVAVLRADVRAHEALERRSRGEPIETPPLTDLEPTTRRATTDDGDSAGLRAAFERWKKQHSRSEGVVAEYARSVDLFIQLHGDTPPARITRDHARKFLAALQDIPWPRVGALAKMTLPQIVEWRKSHQDAPRLVNRSINKQFGGVQTVVKWARDDGMDPFTNLRLEGADPEGGPFEPEELRALFASPVFTTGERPTAGRGDCAFWLPLLALFTGARRGELAALKTADVSQEDGCWTLAIYADKDAGKKLKTKGSARTVPVHPELVRLGFVEYVETARSADHTWLLPAVSPAKALGLKSWTKWFGGYLANLEVAGERKGLHSLRHNFADALRAGGVHEELRDAIMGHTVKTVGRGYGARHAKHRHKTIIDRFGMAQIVEAVGKVQYPSIDLHAIRTPTPND